MSTKNPLRFDQRKIYEYGTRKHNTPVSQPQWVKIPTVRSGAQLIALGVKSVDEYLSMNPENLDTTRPIAFYERTDKGMPKYLYEANPSPKADDVLTPPQTLADHWLNKTNDTEEEPMPQNSVPPDMAIEAIRESLSVVNQTNQLIMQENANLRDQIFRMQERHDTIVMELRKEIHAAEAETTQVRAQLKALEDEYALREEYQTKLDGLADDLSKATTGSETSMGDVFSLIQSLPSIIAMFKSGTPNPSVAAGNHPGFAQTADQQPQPQPRPRPQQPQQGQRLHIDYNTPQESE